jgi:hypothetical protein
MQEILPPEARQVGDAERTFTQGADQGCHLFLLLLATTVEKIVAAVQVTAATGSHSLSLAAASLLDYPGRILHRGNTG